MILGVFFDFWDTLVKLPDGIDTTRLRDDAAECALRSLSRHTFVADGPRFREVLNERRRVNYRLADETRREITTDVAILDAIGACGVERPDYDAVRNATEALYDPYVDVVEACPGAGEAVRAVCDAGIRIGILSNTTWRPFVDRALDKLGLRDAFSPVVSSADTLVRKPDPRIFRIALDALDVDPGRVLMVGDNPVYDVAAARAAGMRTAWYASHGLTGMPGVEPDPPADVSVSNLGELWTAIKESGLV